MNSEAALLIGLIISAVAAGLTQVSGPGIIVPDQPAQTALNVLTIFLPLIAGAFTRYQVYSKNSVADIQAEAAATGDTPPLPPPP